MGKLLSRDRPRPHLVFVPMPHRLILFDALKSLSEGHALVELGQDPVPSFLRRLSGVPDVNVVVGRLRKDGYIGEMETRSAARLWVITPKGKHAYQTGQDWYSGLTLFQKVLGRLGLPYDPMPRHLGLISTVMTWVALLFAGHFFGA